MIGDWKFEDNGRLIHIPCNAPAEVIIRSSKLECTTCLTEMPIELELPAKVYGSYKYYNFRYIQKLMERYITEDVKKSTDELEKKFFIDSKD